MKPLYVKLDDKLSEDLNNFCEKKLIDKSKFVRKVLGDAINAEVQ